MTLTPYAPVGFVDNAAPPINAANLATLEAGIDAVTDEVLAHEALKTGVHGVPSMTNGNGLLWNGTDWVDTNLATQAELDAHAAVKTGVHGIPAMSIGQGVVWDGSNWIATDVATQAEVVASESALLGVWTPLAMANGVFSATVAGTYFQHATAAVANGASVAGTSGPTGTYRHDPTYLAIAGYTTQFRVRMARLTNATAPGNTLTAGLYPYTVAGAAGILNVTMGTVVAGSQTAVASPAASSITQGVGNAFTAPAAGAYILGVVRSGTAAANSVDAYTLILESRHV